MEKQEFPCMVLEMKRLDVRGSILESNAAGLEAACYEFLQSDSAAPG